MIAREYPGLRVKYAKALRAARERAVMARIYLRELRGQITFLTPVQMIRVTFATKSFMESEIEWLKNYERGELNAETEE